jgi:hypothetical protein
VATVKRGLNQHKGNTPLKRKIVRITQAVIKHRKNAGRIKFLPACCKLKGRLVAYKTVAISGFFNTYFSNKPVA